MEYSDFELEDILEKENYKEMCNIFLSFADNDDMKDKLKEILYKGGYDGFGLSSKKSSKDNSYIEGARRISMAYMLLKHPDTFDVLKENNLNLFHGTNANALSNILKYGVNSVDESKREGIEVTTGEEWSRRNGTRNFVSFTDVLEVAESYSTLGTTSDNKMMSFPVVIGTTVEEVLKAGTYTISSDVPEIGVKNKLPLEGIKVILVPYDKVDFVKRIVDNDKIKVLAMDYFEQKFYYIDCYSWSWSYATSVIVEEKLIEFKKKQQYNTKVFKKEEIRNMVKNRLNRLKEKINILNFDILGNEGLENVRKEHR